MNYVAFSTIIILYNVDKILIKIFYVLRYENFIKA